MLRIFLLVSFGAVVIIVAGVFAFGNFLGNKEVAEENRVDLFPARSQERVVEIENKDTAFEVKEEEVQEEEQEAAIECNDYYCFEKHYQGIVANTEISAAFADLKIQYDESTLVRSLCHPLAHVIGRAAIQKYPDVGEAYKQGDHFCWSGYYHGVMEGILYEVAPADLPRVINEICESIPGKADYSFDYYNCVHGLGHGVMYVTQNELFEALELCNWLDGQWEKESCYGGVFMENVITDFENHFTKYLKPSEPLYPCTAVGEKYKRTCYLMQTSYALKINGYDFADAFAQCSTIEEEYKSTCYQSIGRDASGSTVSDIQRTKAYCMLGKDSDQQINCVIGAVKDFISYFHSDAQARQFCAAFSEDIAEKCLAVGIIYYQSFQ